MSRLQHLLGAGEGYTEVRRVEADYPLLTFSFRGDYAVMHLFESPDDCRLLLAALRDFYAHAAHRRLAVALWWD